MSTEQMYATFYVEDIFFGVNALMVQEVLRSQPMTPVPLAPPEVTGLINLRGQIVTALDMRRRLHLPDRDASKPPTNVVVYTDDGPVSLLVDEIGDVLVLDGDDMESLPETVDRVQRDLVVGVHKLDRQLMLVIDLDKTVRPTLVG
ncbi:MAG: chemotaxis protein CheW [Acidimicrobiales bacterium]